MERVSEKVEYDSTLHEQPRSQKHKTLNTLIREGCLVVSNEFVRCKECALTGDGGRLEQEEAYAKR